MVHEVMKHESVGIRLGLSATSQSNIHPLSTDQPSITVICHVPLSGQPMRLEKFSSG